MKKTLSEKELIERSIDKEFKYPLWRKFIAAIGTYKLVNEGDRICVCISGGKDSMVMALLFKHLKKYSPVSFEVKYLVMNPGYAEENLSVIKGNLVRMGIPATIVSTDIFEIANATQESPCYLCAKMRRGALYRIAKELGCNKIALGHHYDDVITTTLMNMLNSGSFQTMLPKLHSTHYEGMEIIRPLYLIKEEDIIAFGKANNLRFIQCACRFTDHTVTREEGIGGTQRKKTRQLIEELKADYSPFVEKNIFKAAENVTLDMVLGHNYYGEQHSFLEDYDEQGEMLNKRIREEGIEESAVAKADREHQAFLIDHSFENLE